MIIRSKKVLIPSLALVAALALGGTAVAVNVNNDRLSTADRDRVSSVALAAVGGGKVLGAERHDDEDVREGDGRFEVTVLKSDGTQVEISLDDNLNVLGNPDVDEDTVPASPSQTPSQAPNQSQTPAAGNDVVTDGRDDVNDRVLTRAEIEQASAAARTRFPGARIIDVDDNDNNDVHLGYDVDLIAGNGVEWNVEMDKAFKITQVERED